MKLHNFFVTIASYMLCMANIESSMNYDSHNILTRQYKSNYSKSTLCSLTFAWRSTYRLVRRANHLFLL